ncbi:MAG: H-NS histone family protein [Pseudomonadota bacterium]
MAKNIKDMSPKEVAALKMQIAEHESDLHTNNVEKTRAAVLKLIEKADLTVEEVLKGVVKAKGRKTGKVAAKYRNPKDASQTWSGRGRRPLWLEAELKSGKSLSSFEI